MNKTRVMISLAPNQQLPLKKQKKQKLALMNRTSSIHEDNYSEKLVGVLHDTGSKHLVILCPGYRSWKDRIPLVNLASAFGDAGLSAFHFDFAGGNVVLLYASKYKDIPTIVNISGRFNLERGTEGRLGKNFLRRIKEHGFIDVKSRKEKVEYRVTEVSLMDSLTTDTRDKIVPVEDAMEFVKLIANHKLLIIDGADHEYTSHQDELASIVLNFVDSSHQGMLMPIGQPSSTRNDKLVRSRF